MDVLPYPARSDLAPLPQGREIQRRPDPLAGTESPHQPGVAFQLWPVAHHFFVQEGVQPAALVRAGLEVDDPALARCVDEGAVDDAFEDLTLDHAAQRQLGRRLAQRCIDAEQPAAALVGQCVLHCSDHSLACSRAAIGRYAEFRQLCHQACAREPHRIGRSLHARPADAVELAMDQRADVTADLRHPIEHRTVGVDVDHVRRARR
jgi:hypothetical protein